MLAVRGMLTVALTATVAHADYVGLRWRDTPLLQLTQGWGTAEIYLQKVEVDGFASTVTGIHFDFGGAQATTPLLDGMYFHNYRTSIPGWATFGVEGQSHWSPIEFGAWSATGAGAGITGPGELVLGSFDVIQSCPCTGEVKSISALAPQDYLGVMGADTLKMVWNANLAGSSYNYVAFAPGAFGNPGWGTRPDRGHQPISSPLQFVAIGIPEPTALLVVVLGTVLLARRGGREHGR